MRKIVFLFVILALSGLALADHFNPNHRDRSDVLPALRIFQPNPGFTSNCDPGSFYEWCWTYTYATAQVSVRTIADGDIDSTEKTCKFPDGTEKTCFLAPFNYLVQGQGSGQQTKVYGKEGDWAACNENGCESNLLREDSTGTAFQLSKRASIPPVKLQVWTRHTNPDGSWDWAWAGIEYEAKDNPVVSCSAGDCRAAKVLTCDSSLSCSVDTATANRFYCSSGETCPYTCPPSSACHAVEDVSGSTSVCSAGATCFVQGAGKSWTVFLGSPSPTTTIPNQCGVFRIDSFTLTPSSIAAPQTVNAEVATTLKACATDLQGSSPHYVYYVGLELRDPQGVDRTPRCMNGDISDGSLTCSGERWARGQNVNLGINEVLPFTQNFAIPASVFTSQGGYSVTAKILWEKSLAPDEIRGTPSTKQVTYSTSTVTTTTVPGQTTTTTLPGQTVTFNTFTVDPSESGTLQDVKATVTTTGLQPGQFLFLQVWKQGDTEPTSVGSPNCLIGDGSKSWGQPWAQAPNGVGTREFVIPNSFFQSNGAGTYNLRVQAKNDINIGCDSIAANSQTKTFVQTAVITACTDKPTLVRAEWQNTAGQRVVKVDILQDVKGVIELQNPHDDCSYSKQVTAEVRKDVPLGIDPLLKKTSQNIALGPNERKPYSFDYTADVAGEIHYDVLYDTQKYSGSENLNKHSGDTDYASDDLIVGGDVQEGLILKDWGFLVDGKKSASVPEGAEFQLYVTVQAANDVTGKAKVELRSDTWLLPDTVKAFAEENLAMVKGETKTVSLTFTASQDSGIHQETYHGNFYLDGKDLFGRLPSNRNEDLKVIKGNVLVESYGWFKDSKPVADKVQFPLKAVAVFRETSGVATSGLAEIHVRQDVALWGDTTVKVCKKELSVPASSAANAECELAAGDDAKYHFEVYWRGDKVVERSDSACVVNGFSLFGCEGALDWFSKIFFGTNTIWFILVGIVLIVVAVIVLYFVGIIRRALSFARA